MTAAFIPGLKLSQEFYAEIIRPILDGSFPGVAHAAGLIGEGSEVLGFDDETSVDHNWGPRLMLFLFDEDHPLYSERIKHVLSEQLPCEFRGYPTNFSAPHPGIDVSPVLQPVQGGPVNHHVSVQTVGGFIIATLGFDIRQPLEPADWLSFSEQHLCTLTRGAVFHDEVGLNAARSRFTYYPRDIWLYLLAAGWNRIGQEEHLMGRAGMAGDELGSALIGARLVRDVMRLCFLMEKTYAPYAKWFGSAFKRLACARELWPILLGACHAETWQMRENYLVQAYEGIAACHNALGLTEPMPEKVKRFHGRPFRVIAQHGFAAALLGKIEDPQVRRIAERPLVGSVDLFSDNVDLVSDPSWHAQLRRLYS
jgi:hypothetical protein